MRFARFTGGVVARVLALFVIVMVLSVVAPEAAPRVGYVEAADGWYNRQVTWWMDDSTNADTGGDVYRVKMTLAWQTTDPYAICYSQSLAAPDGTRFPAYSNNIYKCPTWRYGNNFAADWYPSRNATLVCWVANSFLVSVMIDSCGRLPNNQDYPPYWMSYGSIFRVCTGIVQTPFSYCGGFKSRLTILGSTVRLWNTSAG